MARAKKEAALTPEERLQAALVPDWEWPYKLPENWCWVYAPHIFDIEYGKGLPTKQLSDTGYPVFGANGQIGFYSEYMYKGPQALMSCRGAYSGTMNKSLPYSYVTSNSLIISSPRGLMGTDCIYYLFSALNVSELISGTAQPQVTVQAFDGFPIPLSPLAEQQRIVDRIESLFAKLDEAKEKAQAVVDSFETRKAAILHKAFTGELTAKWREEHGVSIDNWKTTRFDSVAAIRSNLVDPAEYQSFPHIAPDNIEKKTGVLLEYHTIAEDGVTSGKHRFYSGQILYSKIRPYLSKAVVVDFDGLCSADMYPIEAYQNARCLWYYMLSDEFLLQASTAGSRSVLPKINQKELSALTVHLPTNDREQEEIARILDELFDKEQQTKEAAEIVLDQIELMKKSILARAFRGELGTNDPSEESAVELLRQVIEQEDGDVIRPKAKVKRIAIPAEIKPLLSGANEEAIVKLLLKAAPQSVSTQIVMSISKKKFELMDALRNLEKKQIVSKSDSGEYSLVR